MRPLSRYHRGPAGSAGLTTPLSVLVSLVLLACLFGGCAGPTARLPGVAPARVGLPGVRILALDDFQGSYAEQVRQCMLQELLAQDRYVVAEDYRTVSVQGPVQAVVRAEVRPWLEDSRTDGAATVTDHVERTVTITRDDDTVVTKKETVDVQRTVFVPQIQRSAEVAARITVIDPDSGRVMGSDSSTQRFDAVYGGPESVPDAREYDPDRPGIEDLPAQRFTLAQLGCDAGRELGRSLLPQAYVRKADLDIGPGEGPVEQGAWLADQGDWEAAAAVWRGVLQLNPYDAAALYDMGLYWEAKGTSEDFLRARDFYAQALSLEPKTLYSSALDRIEARLSEAGRLAAQTAPPQGQ